jgi:MFS family permease
MLPTPPGITGRVFSAHNLGWMFDGYETVALLISVGAALRQLLEPSQYGQIPVYAGTIVALTLLGWGIGGLIGGVLADYLGRKRTMMLAILSYSLMTGLSAFAWDLLTLWVRRSIPESERWERVAEARKAAVERKRSGASIGARDAALARFTVADNQAARLGKSCSVDADLVTDGNEFLRRSPRMVAA